MKNALCINIQRILFERKKVEFRNGFGAWERLLAAFGRQISCWNVPNFLIFTSKTTRDPKALFFTFAR